LNKPVSASSIQSTEFDAKFAVDGDTSFTRWASVSGSDPQWVYADLGSSTTINRMILYWEAAFATQYKIQVSTDANNWTDVYTEYNGNGGTDDLAVSGTGRYVRMYGTQRTNSSWGYSLFEFAVYGTGGETPAPTTVGVTPAATIPPAGTKGDVNNSGSVDIVDALFVAQFYVGLNPQNFNQANADVNCSGSVDIVDALFIARYYVGLISSFPC
jgi:hypothetical protein